MADVLKISGGTLAGQLVNLFNIPVFARLYGDEIIGGWAFLNTIAMVLYAVSDLGVTDALMVEPDEEKLFQTYRVSNTLVILSGFLSALGFYIFLWALPSARLNISPLFSAVFLGLSVIVLKQTMICYTYLNRDGKYSILMKNPIIQNLSFAVSGTAFALAGFRNYGYYFGWLLAQVITLMHMSRYMPLRFITLQSGDFRSVLSRNRRYVTYQWPNNILIKFTEQLPGLMIRPLFGVAALGQYSITMRGLDRKSVV